MLLLSFPSRFFKHASLDNANEMTKIILQGKINNDTKEQLTYTHSDLTIGLFQSVQH